MVTAFIKAGMLLSISLFCACDRTRYKPGWDYFPDMFYSTAYETYTPNPVFEDGKTMRTPVEGTISRGFIPFYYTINPEDRLRAGKEMVNPYDSSSDILMRGHKVFDAFCAGCHGTKGVGDGILFTSGLYLVKPRSLVAESAKNLRDGEIFHSITLGFGSMGAHGSQVRYNDRWKVVLYIRELQKVSEVDLGLQGKKE